jgi:hypothetical protein
MAAFFLYLKFTLKNKEILASTGYPHPLFLKLLFCQGVPIDSLDRFLILYSCLRLRAGGAFVLRRKPFCKSSIHIRKQMPLAIGLSMLVSAALGTTASASTTPQIVNLSIPKAQTLPKYVESYFSDVPIMVDIAACESHFHQYNSSGSLYRGEINHSDVGVMQINEYYHQSEAEAMGLDITTLQGNLEFARYLYDKEGTAPWSSSSKCWSQSADAKALALNTK